MSRDDRQKTVTASATVTPRTPVVPLAIAIAAVAVNLRPVITTVGPQLEVITDHLGAGDTASGLITAVPVFAFAVVSGGAPLILARLSIRSGLYLALAVTGLGIAVRPWTGTVGFVLATFASALGVGVISVLLPALIRSTTAGSSRLVTVFTSALQAGAALGFAAAVPLAEVVGSWQVGLAWWAVLTPVGVIALALTPEIPAQRPDRRAVTTVNPVRVVTGARAWGLTVFFGLQALLAFSSWAGCRRSCGLRESVLPPPASISRCSPRWRFPSAW
ncbi:MFS transporter [Williamsia sterculiae]|uniref:hypothetical protein n=1 Tax=Williamsia sterculiae TaxID=1344003 RepID=UPI0009703DFC|nr:hypothetical protein [Williamsia sterculiae]